MDSIRIVSIVEYMKSICVIFCCGVRLSCYHKDSSITYPFSDSFPYIDSDIFISTEKESVSKKYFPNLRIVRYIQCSFLIFLNLFRICGKTNDLT
jgi:hypothetical protein